MDWEDVVGPPSRPRLPFASKGASQRGRPFSRHSQSHRLGPEVGGEKGWSSVGVWSSKRDNRNEDVFQGVLTGLTTGFKLGQEKGQGVKGLRDVKAWKNRVQGNLRDWADHLWEISLRVGCLSLRLWSCWVMTWFKLRQWERISLTGWKTRSLKERRSQYWQARNGIKNHLILRRGSNNCALRKSYFRESWLAKHKVLKLNQKTWRGGRNMNNMNRKLCIECAGCGVQQFTRIILFIPGKNTGC